MNNLGIFPPVTLGIFQAMLLQEEWPTITPNSAYLSNFNPRSYKRSDTATPVAVLCIDLFQSTLLQEERQSQSISYQLSPLFQSTLLQEERRERKWDKYHKRKYFNPRSYKRSDVIAGFYGNGLVNFNPRSYKRSDGLRSYNRKLSIMYFNPRSYKRSDILL